MGYGLACLELGLYRHWLDCQDRLNPQGEPSSFPSWRRWPIWPWGTEHGMALYEQRDLCF